MEKGTIWQFVLCAFLLTVAMMILFAEFWLSFLNDPSITYIILAYISFPLLLAAITTSVVVWKKYFTKSKRKTIESQLETRNVKIGLCLGSLTNNGTRILERSEYCPFNEPYLHSMFNYSAVSVLHGETGEIIGPFPMESSSQEEMYYISFGFRINDRGMDPGKLEEHLKEGKAIGVFLLYYSELLDSSILLKKEPIKNILKKAIESVNEIQDLIPELAQIEEEIQFILLF